MMKLILVQDVDKFGKSGSVVQVKAGFARNYLLPRKLAVLATPDNLRRVEQEKLRQEQGRVREKELAESLALRLGSLSLTIAAQTHGPAQGEEANADKLYGSIGRPEIAGVLKEEGITDIDLDAVILDEPIKSTGVYEVKIKLHPEVIAKVKVWVVKK